MLCITALWLLINNLGYLVWETGAWDVSAWDGHENIYILPEGVVVDMNHRRTEAAGFLDRYNNTMPIFHFPVFPVPRSTPRCN